MKSVWVIEQGSYSDYGVTGVYSTKEGAEQMCALINESETYNKATVAEWPLDPGVAEVNAGKKQWRVLMLKDGSTEKVECLEQIDSYELKAAPHVWERSTLPAFRRLGAPDILAAVVWARDAEHAVKSVNEIRIGMIASGQFK